MEVIDPDARGAKIVNKKGVGVSTPSRRKPVIASRHFHNSKDIDKGG